ncbi:hypothetical protein PIIN_04886 [Serendipita indica DSM 11827]|uniref:Uncharacterized protein n=1 Tax=Serendipita indica (strain DSM 11827) TaxID=1109443 RepID=G4THZ7_SERID|nr:hypothetical protein PIIN_04886 [Serendipita indica DSM 11827]
MATTTESEDKSVLQLFDPLTSPVKSPVRTKTPRARERDPQSPVAAFFSTVDKSKHFLATREKPKEPNLIDLGVLQSPPPQREHVEDTSSAPISQRTFATPAPLSDLLVDVVNTPRGHGPAALPIDPFSPPTNAGVTHFQSIIQVPQLMLPKEDDKRNRLIPVDTPMRPDLYMSTNFTPVPANLPYLPASSLRSLAVSSASSTGTYRRRSSIDLDKELHESKPDSSFDILRGEMELGSAEVSFASVNAHDLTKALASTAVEDNDVDLHADQSLLPAKETQGANLLAHEIPLPDSCPTSPESSNGYNEDANVHASKVFPHLRRFSMAKVDEDALQFPSDDTSPGKETISPVQAGRKPIPHARTMSMTSVSSVNSNRSASTVKQATPSPEKRLGYKRPLAKRPSPLTSTTSSPSKSSSTSKRASRPSVVLKGATSRLSLARPRVSLAVERTALAGRASIAPRPSGTRGAMAPPPVPSASSTRTAVGVRPRMSVATTSAKSAISRPVPSTAAPAQTPATSNSLVAPKGVLASGGRANSAAARVPRLSTISSSAPALKPPATKVDMQPPPPSSTLVTARPRTGPLKPRPSSMILPPSIPINTPAPVSQPTAAVTTSKPAKGLPRPRRSSAGAALLARPPLTVDPPVSATTRPTSVAAHRFPRPKSSLSRV